MPTLEASQPGSCMTLLRAAAPVRERGSLHLENGDPFFVGAVGQRCDYPGLRRDRYANFLPLLLLSGGVYIPASCRVHCFLLSLGPCLLGLQETSHCNVPASMLQSVLTSYIILETSTLCPLA